MKSNKAVFRTASRAVSRTAFKTASGTASKTTNKKTCIKTCAFTGHRPEKMPWGHDENSPAGLIFKFRLRESIEYLIRRGYTDFMSGGSIGFDQIAAEIVLSLREEKYPWIRLIMVCPWNGQADKWTAEQRDRWQGILEHSDKVVYVGDRYSKNIYFKRNHYLVDHADLVLAAYNGDEHSGAGMTVRYAHKVGVKVTRLPLEKRAA